MRRRSQVLGALALAALLLAGGTFQPIRAGATTSVPRAHCGPGSRPETGMQGRVSSSDLASGRAARGYTCNMDIVSHFGNTGGFRVYHYVDAAAFVPARGEIWFSDGFAGLYAMRLTNGTWPLREAPHAA